MKVAIAGGHGQVARRLTRLLVANDDTVIGLVRAESQLADVAADGAIPTMVDLEHADVALVDDAVEGCDAIVFAAGAGPQSGPERKWTVDYGAAHKLIESARRLGIRRFVLISAMGVDDAGDGDDDFSVYLRAKAKADTELRAAGLDHTIVKPGILTDDPGTGKVRIGAKIDWANVTRDDVAAVLAAVLPHTGTFRRTIQVTNNGTPIDDAVAAVEGLMPAE